MTAVLEWVDVTPRYINDPECAAEGCCRPPYRPDGLCKAHSDAALYRDEGSASPARRVDKP